MANAWGVAWGGTFIVWGAGVSSPPPAPVYGPPFISVKAEMIDTISNKSEMFDTISNKSEMFDTISDKSEMIQYLSFQSIIDEDS